MIKLENVSVGYGKKSVLKDVSQTFEKGKLTCIIGKNGCGKSTLLKGMMGIISAKCGKVTLDGNDLTELKPVEIASKAAYLSQGKSAPDMTVEQLVLHGRFAHIAYPRVYRQKDREIAKTAMEKMGIADLAGQKLTTLSGGMCQTAYLAMALAQSTDYILLDEPTTYLDVGNSMRLMGILKALAKEGKGVIAVLHDLTIAMKYADEIVVIDQGGIAMCGTPEEVYLSNTVEKVFGVKLNRWKTEKEFAYFCEKCEEQSGSR